MFDIIYFLILASKKEAILLAAPSQRREKDTLLVHKGIKTIKRR
ncbi:MAG: hypothetical protein ABIK77_04400 [candidate division WOR-3 bacterium]